VQVEGEGLAVEGDVDVLPRLDDRVAETTIGPGPGVGTGIHGDLVSVELHHAVDHEERFEPGEAVVGEVEVDHTMDARRGIHHADPERVAIEEIFGAAGLGVSVLIGIGEIRRRFEAHGPATSLAWAASYLNRLAVSST
jgi:hypothetical protein